jgi:hypothetical protein
MFARSVSVLIVMVTVVLSLSVQRASAYLTPEAVFGSAQNTTVSSSEPTHGAASSASGFDRTDPTYLPPNSRAAESEATLQQSQRNFQYADIEEIEVHPAAPAEDTSPARNLLDDETQYELRMERLAESAKNGGDVTIVIGGDGQTVTSDGRVLHSAAPRVTATGPETILMVIVLLLAAVSTVVYAHLRERKTA